MTRKDTRGQAESSPLQPRWRQHRWQRRIIRVLLYCVWWAENLVLRLFSIGYEEGVVSSFCGSSCHAETEARHKLCINAPIFGPPCHDPCLKTQLYRKYVRSDKLAELSVRVDTHGQKLISRAGRRPPPTISSEQCEEAEICTVFPFATVY